METPLSHAIGETQRACDHVSFFVEGKVFEELSPMDISKHNSLHLINVIEKLTKWLEDPLPEGPDAIDQILKKEVVPDLVVYAVQIATAHACNWLLAYRDTLHPDHHETVENATSLDALVLLQSNIDLENDRNVPALAGARRAIIAASAFLARICDKDDHGTELPRDQIGSAVSSVLLREGLRLAKLFHGNLDELYAARVEDIKRKYGNVRIMLGKE
ncbi:MAG TPA: hypothetical protein VI873_03490 [Candidatus Peribacteraceae bacterium]|nr:hypothetical protein [Candidatus Peribacteraceae bacterium]